MLRHMNFEYIGEPEGMYYKGRRGTVAIQTRFFSKSIRVSIVHGFEFKEYLDSVRTYANLEELQQDFRLLDVVSAKAFRQGETSAS